MDVQCCDTKTQNNGPPTAKKIRIDAICGQRQSSNEEERAMLLSEITESSNVEDVRPLLKAMDFGLIQKFLEQHIAEASDPSVHHLFLQRRSIVYIIPDDIMQHILTFCDDYVKSVCSRFRSMIHLSQKSKKLSAEHIRNHQNITAAMKAACDGTHILVHDGKYDEGQRRDTGLVFKKNVQIEGFGDAVWWNRVKDLGDERVTGNTTRIQNGSCVRIENMRMDVLAAISVEEKSTLIMENCTINMYSYTMFFVVHPGCSLYLKNCTLKRTSNRGIKSVFIASTANVVEIKGCTFHGIRGDGIQIENLYSNPSEDFTVKLRCLGNTFHGGYHAPILVGMVSQQNTKTLSIPAECVILKGNRWINRHEIGDYHENDVEWMQRALKYDANTLYSAVLTDSRCILHIKLIQ